MSGYRVIVPTSFTDTTLPALLHGVGAAGFSHRYVMSTLALASGAAVTSVPLSGGWATSPLGKAPTSDASPVYGAADGIKYVTFGPSSAALGVPYGNEDGFVKTVVMVVRPHVGSAGGNYFNGGGVLASYNATQFGTFLTNATNSPTVPGDPRGKWSVVILSVPDDGNLSKLRVNGQESAQVTTGATESANISIADFGGKVPMDIAEIVLYPNALDSTQRASVYANLKAAYPGVA